MSSKPYAPAITWPQKYLPGLTDNYASNQIFTGKGASLLRVWALLSNASAWVTYYDNIEQVTPPAAGPILHKGDTFSFSTHGQPVYQAEVYEAVAPKSGQPGRLAWRAWLDGPPEVAIDVYHPWIVEQLDDGRIRIQTDGSQLGEVAKWLAQQRPNPILVGHQDWLTGLVKAEKEGQGTL